MHSFENQQCAENYQHTLGQPRYWSLTVMAIAWHTDLLPGNTAVTPVLPDPHRFLCKVRKTIYYLEALWKLLKAKLKFIQIYGIINYLSFPSLHSPHFKGKTQQQGATWMPVLPSGIQFSSSVKVGITSRRFPSSSEGTLPTSAPCDFSLPYAISSIHS